MFFSAAFIWELRFLFLLLSNSSSRCMYTSSAKFVEAKGWGVRSLCEGYLLGVGVQCAFLLIEDPGSEYLSLLFSCFFLFYLFFYCSFLYFDWSKRHCYWGDMTYLLSLPTLQLCTPSSVCVCSSAMLFSCTQQLLAWVNWVNCFSYEESAVQTMRN